MAYTFLQDNAASGSGAGQTVAYNSDNAANSILIATVLLSTGSVFESLQDSQGNDWVQIGDFQTASGLVFQVGLFFVGAAKAGPNTVDLLYTNSNFSGLYIAEYSASGLGSTLDAFAVGQALSTTAYSIGPMTVAENGELLFATQYNFPNAAWNGGSQTAGFTIRENVGSASAFMGALDNVNGGSGANTIAATFASAPSGWAGLFAAFTTELASDNFQRPDANPISGSWSTAGGAVNPLQLVSHVAEGTVSGAYNVSYWNAVSWPNDQYSEITLGAISSSTDYSFPVVRSSPSSFTAYLALCELNTGNVYIQKHINGTASNIVGPVATGSFSTGDVIRLTVQGTTLTITKNGTPVATATDSDIAGGSAAMGTFTQVIANATITSWAGGGNLVVSSISGNAGEASATVSYSGPSSGSVTADGSGNYTIPGLADGDYTITPTLAGFTFSPTSRDVTVSGADVTGVDFTGAPDPSPPSGGGTGFGDRLRKPFGFRFGSGGPTKSPF